MKILVIWFALNGHHAMVQQPVPAAQCPQTFAGLTLPSGTYYACATPEEAAVSIVEDTCTLVGHTDAAVDLYTCRTEPRT